MLAVRRGSRLRDDRRTGIQPARNASGWISRGSGPVMSNVAIAVDMGGSHVEFGIVRDDRVVAAETITVQDALLKTVLPELEVGILALVAKTGIALREMAGVALRVCAIADGASSVLATNGKYDDGVGFDFCGLVQRQLWSAVPGRERHAASLAGRTLRRCGKRVRRCGAGDPGNGNRRRCDAGRETAPIRGPQGRRTGGPLGGCLERTGLKLRQPRLRGGRSIDFTA